MIFNQFLLAPILLLLSFSARATVVVTCDNNGGSFLCNNPSPAIVETYRAVTSPFGQAEPSAEISFTNSSGDNVFVSSSAASPAGRISLNVNNLGSLPYFDLAGSGALGRRGQELNVLGDMFGQLEVDISGYVGQNGRPLSQLCANKIESGYFGISAADDNLRTLLINSTTGSNPSCVVTGSNPDLILDAIASSVPSSSFCLPGYTYRQDLDCKLTGPNSCSINPSFLLSRKKFMNMCVSTTPVCPSPGSTQSNGSNSGCIASGGTAYSSVYYSSIDPTIASGTSICSPGYAFAGQTQNYPCPHDGDDPYCANSSESFSCSDVGCNYGIYKKSFKTVYGSVITREAGQSGTLGGHLNAFIYDTQGFSVSYANGTNGTAGPNDMSDLPQYMKYCVQLLDNNSATLAATSPERDTPVVNLQIVTFIPFQVQEPTSLPNNLLPIRAQSDAVGFFKKTDSAVRNYIFKELIQKAP